MNEYASPAPPPLPVTPGTEPHHQGILGLLEAVLRHPQRVTDQLQQGEPARLLVPLFATTALLAACYGVIVASFAGGAQWWAVPAKAAGGLLATATVCVPSLYIFAALAGSPASLLAIAGSLGGAVLLGSLLLIGFAPVAWLFSQSTESTALVGALHLLFWLVALRFAVRFLVGALRQFGLRTQSGVNVWIVIFVLVSLQMTTVLRPWLGQSETLVVPQKKFFVMHWFETLRGSDAAQMKGIGP